MQSAVRYIAIILLLLCIVGGLQAQTATGVLRGSVSDPSGAVVTQATVTITGPNGQKATAATNGRGVYEFKNLAPGKYNLRVTAKGFAAYDLADVTVAPNAPALDITLQVAVEEQTVTVQDENTTVSTDSSSNATAVVIKGKDLDALSDDPDELQSDLEALAGPSAGPNGGQIYIDGFSNGTLPPKSSIREIRVNQNPFSAQYDRLGFGRVEVFTKPGTDKYHGSFMSNVNHSMFNSRNPFLDPSVQVPDYHTTMFNGNFGGPLNKKSSFFFNFHRRAFSEVSLATGGWIPCAGFDLDHPCSAFAPVGYENAFSTPQVNTELSPRIDYQLAQNNTITARYEYEKSSNKNIGMGQYSLPSQLNVNNSGAEHNVQISDTQIINSTMINETRFQFVKDDSTQTDLSLAAKNGVPAFSVMDAFSAGSSRGNSINNQNHYEFQNYTSKVHGTHFIRFGGRLRYNTQDVYSRPNQYGSFTYTSTTGYYVANYLNSLLGSEVQRGACAAYLAGNNPTFVNGWAVDTNGKPVVPYPTTSADCGAAQFSQTIGNPYASVSQTDAGLYVEDDWRVRSNVTLSYGLRFETQNNVDNKANFAPRIGVAWGIGKSKTPKTVVRAGFGMFYDRFGQGSVLQIIRTNAADPQRGVIIQNPISLDPADLTPTSTGETSDQIRYAVSPTLKLPYTMQVAATLERQLTKTAKVTMSYVASRGLHQIAMENLSNVYTYDSAGTFKQQQLMVNSNFNMSKYLSLMGWYVYGHANSNTNGGFPTVPFELASDWGRSSFDVRHRGMIMGTINLPRGFRLNPMIIASSSRPYNIYGPGDPNHDGILNNDRPWFSSGCTGMPVGTSAGDIYSTALGCFSMNPNSANNLGRVPVNYAAGTSSFMTNLRFSKTFGLGKKAESASAGSGSGGGHGHDHGGGPGGMPNPRDMGRMMGGGSSGQRYNLTFSVSARNLLNHVNAANPTGNLSSPNFGVPTATAGWGSANRRVDFQMMFNF